MAELLVDDRSVRYCKECGGELKAGISCDEVFCSLLSLEFTNPGYGSVHFLTVACMMVQHQRYNKPGMVWIHHHLKKYLQGELTERQMLDANRLVVDSGKREWKILREVDDVGYPQIPWTMTIQDVALEFKDEVTYRELIQTWAKSVCIEMVRWLDS